MRLFTNVYILHLLIYHIQSHNTYLINYANIKQILVKWHVKWRVTGLDSVRVSNAWSLGHPVS